MKTPQEWMSTLEPAELPEIDPDIGEEYKCPSVKGAFVTAHDIFEIQLEALLAGIRDGMARRETE